MSITPGTRFGAYEILGAIGKGGMGEVYKARDTRLHREVALKVVSGLFASDPDRLARFEREATVLASLNHPNVAHIYGVAESDGVSALVMELVDGPTLADVIAEHRGTGTPVARVLPFARQIAGALEAAHDQGIVHRDVKPANIKVTGDGTIKVLDFGLAKAAPLAAAALSSSSVMNSPTALQGATEVGVILGTAAYMSPEQARGRPVDRRTDIWAYGVVLFELLTGQPCFARETATDTVAAIVTQEPDWRRVPAPWRRLLQSCLAKEPKDRLRDIGDARLLLEDAAQSSPPVVPRRAWVPWSLVALLAIAMAAGIAALRPRPIDRGLVRLALDIDRETAARALGIVAFSPDGTRMVGPVQGDDARSVLATWRLDQFNPTMLAGTEGGDQPFFSPNGEWIGFFTDGYLKKVAVQGGVPVSLAEARSARGGSWGEDDVIVAALVNTKGLWRIPAGGGAVQPQTMLREGEVTHRWPQVLPGNRGVLFTAHSTLNAYDDATIEVQPLPTGDRKTLWRGGYFGRFVPTDGKQGYLIFVQRGTLFGARFDLDRLELAGAPVPILQEVGGDPVSAAGRLDVSSTGTLAYVRGSGVRAWPMVWLDSAGKISSLFAKPTMYYSPRLSPDGRRIAVAIDSGAGMDIFVHDFQRDTMTRLTFTASASDPVWTPDGTHLVCRSNSGKTRELLWIRADGAGGPQRLLSGVAEIEDLSANAFSADGRLLIFAAPGSRTATDLWTVPLDLTDPDHPKAGPPAVFLQTVHNELRPAFSTDGRWVAYVSDESGRSEVYVRPFTSADSSAAGKWQISTGGGSVPIWSRNGREIFFESPDRQIMVSEYTVGRTSFGASKPRLWSSQRLLDSGFTNLDLAPDGKRFVIPPAPEVSSEKTRVSVVLNFIDELRRRVR